MDEAKTPGLDRAQLVEALGLEDPVDFVAHLRTALVFNEQEQEVFELAIASRQAKLEALRVQGRLMRVALSALEDG